MLVLLPLLISAKYIYGQQLIKGTVYNYSGQLVLEGVQVKCTSGTTASTDKKGRYSIIVASKDSLSFYYAGKETDKYSADLLPKDRDFDLYLQVKADLLPPVFIEQEDHRSDSLSNRAAYNKVFNYSPVLSGTPGEGAGLSLSTDLFLSARKMNQMNNLKQRLEREENEAYIDSRFTKALVKRLTGLQPPALDTFMIKYRPTRQMLEGFETDYDYYRYIRDSGRSFAILSSEANR